MVLASKNFLWALQIDLESKIWKNWFLRSGKQEFKIALNAYDVRFGGLGGLASLVGLGIATKGPNNNKNFVTNLMTIPLVAAQIERSKSHKPMVFTETHIAVSAYF